MYSYWYVILCACIVTRAQDGPSVNTAQGVVIGRNMVDGSMAFYGIPYAGPTSGVNRFKEPTPAPSFPGPFHAIHSEILCAQPSPRGIIGIEDCLTLSIFTKSTTTPKPVIVWIYGEEFSKNTNGYSPVTLVLSDLVVVKINYRLSIFGFLCLGVTDAPGNAGLKDTVQALKWIQDNIAGFGGDPNNVILLGHGSGAAMVDLITLSPLATGLMHKVIALSGSGLAPWAVSYDPVVQARDIGDRIGYAGKGREQLAKLLTTTDINILANPINRDDFPNNTVLFGPCLEDRNLNPNKTFLADVPLDILRSGKYSDIPYIGAHTDGEGTIKVRFAVFNQWLEKMQQNFSQFIPADLNFKSEANKSEENKSAIINKIREFYFDTKGHNNLISMTDFLDYEGDATILVPVTRNVRERALTSKSEVRHLTFAYRGTHNTDWPYPQIPFSRVRHGGILNFLFNNDLKTIDGIVRDALIQRVTAFAYTGNPNPKNETFTTWLPVEPTVPNTLYVSGEEVGVELSIFKEELLSHRNKEEIEFWEYFYSRYYVPPKPVSSASNLSLFSFMVLLSQIVLGLL